MDPLEGAYNGWAGDFSLMMSRVTESPRSFYFMSALTALGLMLSGRITIASAIQPQTRLYTLLLGESADDRKSTAIKLTVKFFQEALSDFPVCWGAGSAEGLAEQLEKRRRLLLVFDEFRTFVSKSKIETSVLLPLVNILFESNRYQSATKKRSIDLDEVHLSILAASTVQTYENIFNAQFLDIGFVNRLFVVKDSGRKLWSIPPKVNGGEKETLKRHLGEMLKMVSDASNGGPVEMGLTAEAGMLFDEWYHDLPRTQIAKRLDTYGHRFMPLLAINAGKTEIDLKTVEQTITFLNYEYKIREDVDPIDADGKIATVEEKVRRNLRVPMTLRDVKRAVNYQRYGLFVFNAAVNNLLRAGEIKIDRKRGLYYKVEA
ncbi:MAG: hypothetical protein ACFFCW_33905 [Candidatus Hodarchaeota archaeon]